MTHPPLITARLQEIHSRISAAKRSSGLAAPEITLIAVSKGQPVTAIEEAIKAGHLDFGENRVQEILEKWPPLKERYPHVQLHFIGALQTNKAEEAVKWCDVIHSIDRERLADAIKKAADQSSTAPKCFIQVNTGEEPQKSGVVPAEAATLVDYCRTVGLPLCGLMCVPPSGENPAPHFALLAKIAKHHGLENLSMGMSADFETAITFGATYVRVGTAIFGERLQEPQS